MKKPARPERNEDFSAELMAALGEDGFFALTEAYGGIRLYVPGNPANSDLPETIGLDIATRLSNRFPGSYMRIPLAREFRAARYHKEGATNRDIARRLGITETGVDHLIRRMRNRKPAEFRRPKDPRQTDLFE
jgi:hypothetical protein